MERLGDYEASRQLRDDEMTQRALAIEAIGAVNMPILEEVYYVPVDPMDDLQCDGCQ